MYPTQWLAADESFQPLDAEGKFAESKGPLVAQAPAAQPREILVGEVFRAVDDAQVLPTSTLDGRLGQPTLPSQNEVQGLDYHALTASFRQSAPPVDPVRLAVGVGHVHDLVRGRQQELR